MTSYATNVQKLHPLPGDSRAAVLPSQPLYAQIKEALRSRILEGHYKPHEQLPSESELMAAHGVSRITVRQALSDLQNEGLIFRVHGKGSFVSKPKAFQDLGQLQGFGEAMRKMGYETYSRLLALRQVTPTPQVAERLQLARRAKATEIRRLRFLNREPISLDVTWLPAAIGQRLAKEDLATRDIFVILENDYRIALGHADLQIGSTLADEALAPQLRVEPGAPVLVIDRLTHTADGSPLDYEHLYYRGDAFQYKVRVERTTPEAPPAPPPQGGPSPDLARPVGVPSLARSRGAAPARPAGHASGPAKPVPRRPRA